LACANTDNAPACLDSDTSTGVFRVDSAVGQEGTECTGINFHNEGELSDNGFTLVRLMADEPVPLPPDEHCGVVVTLTALRLPDDDLLPDLAGVQTLQFVSPIGTNLDGSGLTGTGTNNAMATVLKPAATMTTAAVEAAMLGEPITASATVTGPEAATAPTGKVDFALFAPGDTQCEQSPIFESTNELDGGTATSNEFIPEDQGTYYWTAAYRGDDNYEAEAAGCDTVEFVSVVTGAETALAVAAPSETVVGQPVTASATLSGGDDPTGTITFAVFGPNNSECSGTPSLTSTVDVDAGSTTYSSGVFSSATGEVPAWGAGGTYRVVASYSGDADDTAASVACEDAAVTEVALKGDLVSTITVAADTSPATLPAPGGSVIFALFLTNNSPESVQITGLSSDVHGDLAGQGTCAVGTSMTAAAPTYACSYIAEVTGEAGDPRTATITATVTDGTNAV
ncbi:MAG: Ig-like domain repeat protein, partial [Actinobacteria bacterium]|nr:Ig-like domain repeat protein [Actinomycetota bacterium]